MDPTAARLVSILSWTLLLFGETATGILLPDAPTGPYGLSTLFLVGAVGVLTQGLVALRGSASPSARTSGVHSWTPAARTAIAGATITRALVFAAGLAAVWMIGYSLQPFQFRVSHDELLNLPARFDAGWYLGLARHGYSWSDSLRERQQNVAFFPVFPLLMRAAGDLLTVPAKIFHAPDMIGGGDGRMIWGGAAVSFAAFILALRRLYVLSLALDGRADRASRGVWLLACYPFAYFFGQPYAESVFLLEAISAVALWRSDRTGAASAWGIAAGLTRSNGWTLAVPFLVDVLATRQHRTVTRVLSSLAPLLGPALFSAYLLWLTGHPFAWVEAQTGWGSRVAPLDFVTARFAELGSHGLLGYLTANVGDAVTAGGVLLALGGSIYLLWRREWLLGTFAWAYLAPALLINLPATGRMTAVVFPTFLCLASALSGRAARVTSVAFMSLQCLLAARYFLWLGPY